MSNLIQKISNSTFLIVDDQQFLCSVLSDLMRGFGAYDSHQAKNGAHAIEMLATLKPDIIFTDLNMEPVNGFQLTHWVRRSPDSPNHQVPIIMLTGNSDIETIRKSRDFGVSELLIKPVIPKQVLAKLHTVLLEPRDFINEKSYVGPCRRRQAQASYKGPFRRACDPMQIQLTTEAAKKAANKIHTIVLAITKAATGMNPKSKQYLTPFIDSVPVLKKLAIESDNMNVAKAISSLETYLQAILKTKNLQINLLRQHMECIIMLSGPKIVDETKVENLLANLRHKVMAEIGDKRVA